MEMVWYLPILIFCARIVDVSLGTVRMILVISGRKYLAALLGFFEVLVWVLAVGGAIGNLTNPVALVAYAGGFATGTVVGVMIEARLAMGYRMVRVMGKQGLLVARALRDKGLRATLVDGEGRDGPVKIVFSVVKRRRLREVLATIDSIAPESFVTV